MQRWRGEWRSIESRLAGLESTATLVTRILNPSQMSLDAVITNALRPAVDELSAALQRFLEQYPTLPTKALESLTTGLSRIALIKGDGRSWQSVMSRALVLVSLRAEIDALLTEPEMLGRRATELAFVHLSRTLIVDPVHGKRWRDAFNTTQTAETTCEQLGAVHLLSHRIWAFKVGTTKERTDLVLNEQLAITSEVDAADALVLTEWKIARSTREVETQAKTGMVQAGLYAGSSMAAHELATVRYVVVVTSSREAMPSDEMSGGVTYRFINVAVDPASPSTDAKRLGGSSQTA